MNLDTVRKCANMAASARQNAFGFVDKDILELLAELDAAEAPPAPAEAPAAAE